jgi:hypothetical protein
MLRTTLAVLRDAGRPLCLAELAETLAVDESTLEGMLETLVARGRLRAIEPVAVGCDGCPIRSGCFIMRDGVARTYALASAFGRITDPIGVVR